MSTSKLVTMFIPVDQFKMQPVQPADGKHFTLAEVQKFVGGYVELLRLPDGHVMLINEEGKLKGLPENGLATKLALEAHAIADTDWICGPVLVCPEAQFD